MATTRADSPCRSCRDCGKRLFVGANRNKRSVTLDIAKLEEQTLALRLIEGCDVLVENFKAGALTRYEQLRGRFPV